MLNRYGVQAIVMNTFEYAGGQVYLLAPALADPPQTAWKLVYNDPQALVFMRTPPPGVQPLNSLDVLTHMEDECDLHIEHEPEYTRCARSLGQIFAKIGDFPRARKWVRNLSRPSACPGPRRGAGLPAVTVTLALTVPQAAGAHGEPDHELGVGLIAPQADVLHRKIDGERVRHLILHALE